MAMRLTEIDAAPALLSAALALGLLVQALAPPPPAAPATAVLASPHRGRARPPAVAEPATIPPYAVILARPLFSPSRSASGAAAPDAAPAGTFALVGLATEGSAASAAIRTPSGLVHSLRLGEALEGWKLVAVGADRAVLRQGDAVQSIRLGAPPKGQTAPAARIVAGNQP